MNFMVCELYLKQQIQQLWRTVFSNVQVVRLGEGWHLTSSITVSCLKNLNYVWGLTFEMYRDFLCDLVCTRFLCHTSTWKEYMFSFCWVLILPLNQALLIFSICFLLLLIIWTISERDIMTVFFKKNYCYVLNE